MVSNVADLRKAFLEYFQSQGHTLVASSPLVPANDPTLLFTNAGMVQFKETFLGTEQRSYNRAVTCQRCVRAGGKHNDLDNVGYTARHHTFFEMLGNFSFGDYFKREAINYAWKFLTEELKLPKEKLWITVYEDDQEAEDIWLKELKVDPTRFSRCGEKDNFWSMGDTGPCGPCSEIFYDHGEDVAGGPPGSPEEDGDRYIEIWNLVFMQYNRDTSGTLTPLPKPSVDTGMGLERLAAVLQHVHSNYEIDLFQALLKAVGDIADEHDYSIGSLRVIADHIRACAFLIVDGVVPSNEGRGYVLRRILRRAIRHGHKLGIRGLFFHQLVKDLDAQMGEAYPELRKVTDVVERVIKQEEERFATTLDHGMRVLEEAISQLDGSVITGDIAFKLYDTYGFPVDLTADIARERELSVDTEQSEQLMEAQRQRARQGSQFEGNWEKEAYNIEASSEFTGYSDNENDATVVALFADGKAVDTLSLGQQGRIILDRTPFYAESGGQVGDTGELSNKEAQFTVSTTQKMDDVNGHVGTVKQGMVSVGDSLQAKIDRPLRAAIARNHSATHLLHSALRNILGEHVKQKGSLVEGERLRFDFAHFEAITPEQLAGIERLVNQHIMLNLNVDTKVMSLDAAVESGAMALFGEKYADDVRVLSMGDVSVELCGGTHVNQTGDIGLFKITSESGIAAGVRRIEAVTGTYALEWVTHVDLTLTNLASSLKTPRDNLNERIQQLLEQNRQNEKDIAQLKAKIASNQGSDLVSQAADINGAKVLAAQLDNIEVKQLRDTLDQLKSKLGSAIVVLGTVNDDKVVLVAGVTKELSKQIKAGELINYVAQQVGGRGGGRPDMAQAGGSEPAQLPSALQSVQAWVEERMA